MAFGKDLLKSFMILGHWYIYSGFRLLLFLTEIPLAPLHGKKKKEYTVLLKRILPLLAFEVVMGPYGNSEEVKVWFKVIKFVGE